MEKLKSSFKSLHGAITNMKPSPTCIQEPKTQSFREADLYSSFCHLYCDSATTSPSSSGHSKPNETSCDQPPIDIHLLHLDEENVCSEAATMSSSSSSSSPPRTIRVNDDSDNFPRGPISSKRFFFSPRTTKSIMEEAKPEAGIVREVAEARRRKASFCDGSMTVTMASRDPYCDFRASMEEMVVAHELRDWHCLQELLHCYVRLNEKKHHKVIVLAFADLLMQLMSGDKENRPAAPPHLACYDGEVSD